MQEANLPKGSPISFRVAAKVNECVFFLMIRKPQIGKNTEGQEKHFLTKRGANDTRTKPTEVEVHRTGHLFSRLKGQMIGYVTKRHKKLFEQFFCKQKQS
jgi:hypothetical protein